MTSSSGVDYKPMLCLVASGTMLRHLFGFGACPHRANPVWCFSPVSVVLCERVLFGVVGEAFTTVKNSVECLLAYAVGVQANAVLCGSLLLSPLWLWQLSVCEGPCRVLLALAWIDVCACVVGLQAMWLTIVKIAVGKLLAYMFGVVCLFDFGTMRSTQCWLPPDNCWQLSWSAW